MRVATKTGVRRHLTVVKVVAGQNGRNGTYDVTIGCGVVENVADWNGKQMEVFRNGKGKLARK